MALLFFTIVVMTLYFTRQKRIDPLKLSKEARLWWLSARNKL